MRVLHVIPSLDAADGGPSEAVRVMRDALAARGVAVEIATTGVAQAEEAGVRHFPRQTRFYKFSFPLARWLWRHARDYDLLHVHALFSFSSVAASMVSRWRGVPYVLRPLGTLSPYGVTRRRPWLKRISLALLDGPALRGAAAVHFTSDMERDEAGESGIRLRPAVIPLALAPVGEPKGVERLLERFPTLRGAPCVLFLSRLDPKKNLEVFLHAAALCKNRFPQARWLVAGDGDADYVASLHALAASLGLGDCVQFAGHLGGEEKQAAFALSQIFVLPSKSENFGIAVAEALQAGLPCVLSPGVALASLVSKESAGLVVEATPEAVAGAVMQLLGDPSRRDAAAGRARALADREFSPAAMAGRLEELYRSLLVAPGASHA